MTKTSLHTHMAVARLPGVSYRLSCICIQCPVNELANVCILSAIHWHINDSQRTQYFQCQTEMSLTC